VGKMREEYVTVRATCSKHWMTGSRDNGTSKCCAGPKMSNFYFKILFPPNMDNFVARK